MSTKIDVLSELASRLTKKGGEDLKILVFWANSFLGGIHV
jgi:hypothetical protein